MTMRRITVLAAAMTGSLLLLAAPSRADLGLDDIIGPVSNLADPVPLDAVVDPAVDLGLTLASLF
ncbi:hypothetical protein [Nonomuraea jiangxiensis]|uniref:Uncharacterized protein n=1 Tax=Nonomuraea jiangxiensis TaxID=633440 RepID=A0A1G9QZ78_9ACTN|nr:hypothetical protein [Nonomuraea jiangxiensis]SDM16328.1 hypothetical protein SAMN05421869_13766 [Nonomuraea jiangxiensis]